MAAKTYDTYDPYPELAGWDARAVKVAERTLECETWADQGMSSVLRLRTIGQPCSDATCGYRLWGLRAIRPSDLILRMIKREQVHGFRSAGREHAREWDRSLEALHVFGITSNRPSSRR